MDGKLVGFSLFCFVYYTWVGKSIYLDDLYVKPDARGQGIGTRLMKVDSSTFENTFEKSSGFKLWFGETQC